MDIFIKSPIFETTIYKVLQSSTILSLKESIQLRFRIGCSLQRFIYNSRELDDSRTFSEYNIPENSTINLQLSLKGGGFELFVKTLTGKTIKLDVDDNELVENVRRMLSDKEGIPTEKIVLIFTQSRLEDGRFLMDYNINFHKNQIHAFFKK